MPKSHPELTVDRARELLSYDPITGVFVWMVNRGAARPGIVAGSRDHYGYLCIRIDRKHYKSHRLAWFFVYGKWPAHELDHINGARDDNRIANLREATSAENRQNHALSPRNTSGYPGVSWDKDGRRWRVQIYVHGKEIRIGRFQSLEDAVEARAKAKAKYHYFQPEERSMKPSEAIAAAQPFTET